jgi:hypothetical protein
MRKAQEEALWRRKETEGLPILSAPPWEKTPLAWRFCVLVGPCSALVMFP